MKDFELAVHLSKRIKQHDRAAHRAAMHGQHTLCGVHTHAAKFLADLVQRIANGELHA